MCLRAHIIFLFGSSSSFFLLSSMHKYEEQYPASVAIFSVQISQDMMLIKIHML